MRGAYLGGRRGRPAPAPVPARPGALRCRWRSRAGRRCSRPRVMSATAAAPSATGAAPPFKGTAALYGVGGDGGGHPPNWGLAAGPPAALSAGTPPGPRSSVVSRARHRRVTGTAVGGGGGSGVGAVPGTLEGCPPDPHWASSARSGAPGTPWTKWQLPGPGRGGSLCCEMVELELHRGGVAGGTTGTGTDRRTQGWAATQDQHLSSPGLSLQWRGDAAVLGREEGAAPLLETP